jgi:hypothetical protein
MTLTIWICGLHLTGASLRQKMARGRSGGRPSWKKIRIHRQYTVEEAARETGKCRATLRRWLKNGLPALTEKRPVLILGEDLANFIRGRRKRTACALDHCYCFKCRAPRRPALAMADYTPRTGASGNITAICEVCGGIMNKSVALSSLSDLRRLLEITIQQRQPHLAEHSDPCQNVNSSEV